MLAVKPAGCSCPLAERSERMASQEVVLNQKMALQLKNLECKTKDPWDCLNSLTLQNDFIALFSTVYGNPKPTE